MSAIWKQIFLWCKNNRPFLGLATGLVGALTVATLCSGHTPLPGNSLNQKHSSGSSSNAAKSKSAATSKLASNPIPTADSIASSNSSSSSGDSSNSSDSSASDPNPDSDPGSDPMPDSDPDPGPDPDPGSNPQPDPESKLKQVVFTSSKADQGSLPTGNTTLSCSSMSALFVYGIWEYIPDYHKALVLLYDPEGSLFNQFQVEFNMDEGWQDTHRLRTDLIPVEEQYPAYIYTGFGSGGWEDRLLGTWRANIYLDAPNLVWDPSQEKNVWKGEGDTALQETATFDLTP